MVVLAGCGGGGGGGGGGGAGGHPPGGMPTATVVGMTGGAVTSSDGKLALAIPAGAVGGNVTITTEPATPPAAGAVGTVYEIGPSGTQFAMPVTLTLHYAAADVAGMTESSLRVATFAGGSWQILPGAVVDTQDKTVSGVTTHLSPYAIVTEAAGKTCATVQANYPCADPGVGGGGRADVHAADLRRRDQRLRPISGLGDGQLHRRREGLHRFVLLRAQRADLLRRRRRLRLQRSGHGHRRRRRRDLPARAPLRDRVRRVRRLSGRDAAGVRGHRDRLRGWLLLPARGAGVCRHHDRAPVFWQHERRNQRLLVAAAALRRRSGMRAFRGRDRAVVHRHGERLQGDLLLRGRLAAGLSAGGSGGGPESGLTPTAAFPLSDAGAMGGTSGGGTGATTGTGGATGGGMMCEPGAACQPGQRCGIGSPTGACMECTCDGGGHLVCAPCPDKPDGGGAGATTGTGGMTGGGGGATTGTGGTTGGGRCA